MQLIVPLFPGIPGGPELLIILVIVVLLFGANKVPQLARASGQAMGEFKRGREDIEAEIRAGASSAASSGRESAPAERAESVDEVREDDAVRADAA